MLTIICNFSNGLYFVYLLAVDHSFHCNLDLETCPDLKTCLKLVLLPNYVDLSYKTVKLHLHRIIFCLYNILFSTLVLATSEH